ncbi:MAG TPA: flavodoxin family protein [Clostridia bacterium]|nr:flavodoxin family protein [Clostridia bacterium]
MTIRIVAINGSPRKKGHTGVLLQRAVEAAQEIPGVKAELIHLAGKKIHSCLGCAKPDGRMNCREECAIKDDMSEIYPKLVEADGLIVGTSVYYCNVSGLLKNFMDRCNSLKFRRYRLADKVGGALAVAAHQHGGVETAVEAIYRFFYMQGMVVVNDGAPTYDDIKEFENIKGPRSEFSAVWDMTHYPGGFADPRYGAILEDPVAVVTSRALGRRVARVALWLKAGMDQIGANRYGYDMIGS